MSAIENLKAAAEYADTRPYPTLLSLWPEGVRIRMSLPGDRHYQVVVPWLQVELAEINIVLAQMKRVEETNR